MGKAAELTIGQQIRARRLELGLTQIQTAELLGMKQGDLSKIENDKRTITARTLQRIARVLGVEVRLEKRNNGPGST